MRRWEDRRRLTVGLNSQSRTLLTIIIFNESILNQTHQSHRCARYTVYTVNYATIQRHKEPIKSAEGARPQRMYAAHAGSETRDGWVICSQERHINIISTPLQLRSMLHAPCAAAETRCSERGSESDARVRARSAGEEDLDVAHVDLVAVVDLLDDERCTHAWGTSVSFRSDARPSAKRTTHSRPCCRTGAGRRPWRSRSGGRPWRSRRARGRRGRSGSRSRAGGTRCRPGCASVPTNEHKHGHISHSHCPGRGGGGD